MNPEVFRDLLDVHAGLTVLSNAHNVVTELGRVGLGHSNILPGRPPGQARSDVTYSCSSPFSIAEGFDVISDEGGGYQLWGYLGETS